MTLLQVNRGRRRPGTPRETQCAPHDSQDTESKARRPRPGAGGLTDHAFTSARPRLERLRRPIAVDCITLTQSRGIPLSPVEPQQARPRTATAPPSRTSPHRSPPPHRRPAQVTPRPLGRPCRGGGAWGYGQGQAVGQARRNESSVQGNAASSGLRRACGRTGRLHVWS